MAWLALNSHTCHIPLVATGNGTYAFFSFFHRQQEMWSSNSKPIWRISFSEQVPLLRPHSCLDWLQVCWQKVDHSQCASMAHINSFPLIRNWLGRQIHANGKVVPAMDTTGGQRAYCKYLAPAILGWYFTTICALKIPGTCMPYMQPVDLHALRSCLGCCVPLSLQLRYNIGFYAMLHVLVLPTDSIAETIIPWEEIAYQPYPKKNDV